MADLRSTTKLFDDFKASVSKGDLQGAKQKLSRLKLSLTQLPGLPPVFQQTKTQQQELQLARDILEQAVFLSVRLQDEAAFERNYLQLNTYYTDTRHLLPASRNEHLIVGLNLLRLLVQNRIAEFHTDLELLSPEMQQNEYVKLATQLEQWLMEGSYNKVLDARGTVPDQSYSYFMEKLLTTVRDEIAGSSERAYASLSVPEAMRLMLFSSHAEVAAYAEERDWQLRDGSIFFQPVEEDGAAEIPAIKLINNTLTYARELERIV